MNAYILLVEDEEKLARFVELELMHEGYQVEKSGNGREALEMALKNNYDLILLDIMLPGLNGLEVLRRLLKEKEVPVILLTARDAVMDKVSGLDAGAVDYITKPFAIEELLARIRVALKLHAGHWTAGQGNGSRDQEEGVFKWQDLVLDDRRPTGNSLCSGHCSRTGISSCPEIRCSIRSAGMTTRERPMSWTSISAICVPRLTMCSGSK